MATFRSGESSPIENSGQNGEAATPNQTRGDPPSHSAPGINPTHQSPAATTAPNTAQAAANLARVVSQRIIGPPPLTPIPRLEHHRLITQPRVPLRGRDARVP